MSLRRDLDTYTEKIVEPKWLYLELLWKTVPLWRMEQISLKNRFKLLNL